MSQPANSQVAADTQVSPSSQQQSSLRTMSPEIHGSPCYSIVPIQPYPPQGSIQGSLRRHALPKQPTPETSDFVTLQYRNKESVLCNRSCCSSTLPLQKQSDAASKMNLYSQKRQRRAKDQSLRLVGDAIVEHQPLCGSFLPSTTMQLSPFRTECRTSGLGEIREYEGADSPSRSVSSQKLSTYPTPLTAFSVPTPTEESQSLGSFPALRLDDNYGTCLYELLPKANDHWDFYLNDAMFAGAGAEPSVDHTFSHNGDPDTDYLEHGWFDFNGTDTAQSYHLYSSAQDDQLCQINEDNSVSEWVNLPTSTGAHAQAVWPSAPNEDELSTTIMTPTYNFVSEAGTYPMFPNATPNLPNSNHGCAYDQESRDNVYESHLPILDNVEVDHPGVEDEVLDNFLLNSPLTQTEQRGGTDGLEASEFVGRNRQNHRNTQMDRQLVEWKRQGLSYKTIKERGGFQEAESTLRGRYRTLTKSRDDRLRKPTWPKQAIDALVTAVQHFTRPSGRQCLRGGKHAVDKIPWKKVAEWMVKERGCYRYGNATVKKKYQELLQSHRGLV